MRHAAVEESKRGWHADPPLSDAGRAQASALAARLAAVRFDRCLASHLVRAQETAAILAAAQGLAVETHECLAEGKFGALDGVPRDEAPRRFPEYYRLGRTVLPRLAAAGRTAPGGETRAEFVARARAAADLLREPLLAPNANVLVVSHGGLLCFLIALLLGHEPRDEATYGFENCGVARIVAYAEAPAYGPFPMLMFTPP